MARGALLVGGAATAAAAALAVAALRHSRRSEAEEESFDDDVEELPFVAAETVVSVFTKLWTVMNANVSQVMRRINAQGGAVPQNLVTQYLLEHFETQLGELQAHVFKEAGVTEQDVEFAVEYYEASDEPGGPPRDESVVDAVNQLRQLYVNIGGSLDLDLPEDLTAERMCQVFEEYMLAVAEAKAALQVQVAAIKAKGVQITTEQFAEARQAKIQEKIGVVLKKHRLNSLLFQVALDKFNDHPLFQAKIAAIKPAQA